MDLRTLDEVIPQDYVHVFLIRNPLKAIPSLFKVNQDHKGVPIGEHKIESLLFFSLLPPCCTTTVN